MSSIQTFQSSKKRVGFVDLSKGFCICLVVLLHVFGETAGETFDMLNLFRMPLYFILSGMFFKRYGGFLDFFKKKTNKLLIPFLITYLLTCIPSIFVLSSRPLSLSSFWNEESYKVNLGCNGAAWFLLCLFFQNILFYLIYKASDNVIVVSSVSIVTGLVGYAMNVYGCHLPLWIDTAMTALPFFLFGYALRKYSEVLYCKMNGMYMAITALALFVLMAVNHYNHVMGTTVLSYGDNAFNMNVVCLYFGGISGFWIVFMLSKCLNYLPVFSYVGRYSIVVLLTHLLYLLLIRNVLFKMGIDQSMLGVNVMVFFVIIFLSLPTIRFCIKYLPYWFAQKDLIK